MNYIIHKTKIKKKNSKLLDILIINGFPLPTKSNKFTINGEKITNIIITNKKLASPFVTKIVLKKYNKLIQKLTDHFISDEDPGTAMSEVLNEIEKFKDEIKRKYRKYLKKKELEKMATELKLLQQEAKTKQVELYYILNEKINTNSRSK